MENNYTGSTELFSSSKEYQAGATGKAGILSTDSSISSGSRNLELTNVEAVQHFNKIKEGLDGDIKNFQQEAKLAVDEAKIAVKTAEKINSTTVSILIAVIVAFTLAFIAITLEYLHNYDENRKNFYSLLKDYQTKEQAKEDLQLFKSCVYSYGFSVCTKNNK